MKEAFLEKFVSSKIYLGRRKEDKACFTSFLGNRFVNSDPNFFLFYFNRNSVFSKVLNI